jgi:hypothetical protein
MASRFLRSVSRACCLKSASTSGSVPRAYVPSLVTTSAMRVAALPKFASVHMQTPFSFLPAHDD